MSTIYLLQTDQTVSGQQAAGNESLSSPHGGQQYTKGPPNPRPPSLYKKNVAKKIADGLSSYAAKYPQFFVVSSQYTQSVKALAGRLAELTYL